MIPAGLTSAEQQRISEVDRLAASGDGAIRELLGRLDAPSWAVRRAVVAALASLGDVAIGPLCDLLRSSRDDEARIAATVDALVASIGQVEDAVRPLADDSNPAVVAGAGQHRGRRRAPGGGAPRGRRLGPPGDHLAGAAIEALGRIGGRAAIDSLIGAASSGNFFRVFPAIDVLGRSGDPRAVPALAGLIGNPMYGPEAVRALGRTGEKQAVAPLAARLFHGPESSVRLAAHALGDLLDRYEERYGDGLEAELRAAAPADRAVRRLVSALREADCQEQLAIARLLGILGGELAVATLTRMLDEPPPVSGAAAAALKQLGRESDQPLLQALREGDAARRRILLPLLGRGTAAAEVARCLGDADPTVRALAAEALARIGNPAFVPQLFPLLGDESMRVVQAAIGAIQSLGDPRTRQLALEAARSPEPAVRRAALRILSYFGYPSALPVFEAALHDPDPRIRDAALHGLAFLEAPQALDALLAATRADDVRTRAVAMRALGQARGDLRVTSYLLRGLHDLDPWVRYYALQALGQQAVEVAAGPIAARLEDEAGQVRVAAVDALSHLQSPVATEALRRAADAADPDVVRSALIGLGIRRHPDVLPILLDRAVAGEAATRLVAISAMADFDDPRVEEALEQAARDEDESVRTAAVGFLAARAGLSATPRLIRLASHHPVDALVDQSLGVQVEGRVEGLLEGLESADDEQAQRLVSALLKLRPPDVTDLVRRVLALENPAARRAAVSARRNLRAPAAREALRAPAAAAPDLEVRRIATLLLAE